MQESKLHEAKNTGLIEAISSLQVDRFKQPWLYLWFNFIMNQNHLEGLLKHGADLISFGEPEFLTSSRIMWRIHFGYRYCSTSYYCTHHEISYRPFHMRFGLTYSYAGVILTPKIYFILVCKLITLWFHFHNFKAFNEKDKWFNLVRAYTGQV